MKEFEVHKLNKDGLEKCKKVKTWFEELFKSVENLFPDECTYHETEFKRSLERACFYAKKTIALDRINQEDAEDTIGGK